MACRQPRSSLSRGGGKTHSNSPAAPEPDQGARCRHRPAASPPGEKHRRAWQSRPPARCAPGPVLRFTHPDRSRLPRAPLAAPHTPSLAVAALTRDALSAAIRLPPAHGRPGLARGVCEEAARAAASGPLRSGGRACREGPELQRAP